MKRNKLFQALLMTGVLLLTGCGEEVGPQEPSEPSQETIKLTGLNVTVAGNLTELEVNKTVQLTAVATPEGADASVTWSSSSTEIATISETGLVTGVKEGQVILKATSKVDSNIFKEVPLRIIKEKQPDPESIAITLEGDATEVKVGGSLQATAKVSPEKAEQGVIWKSSDPDTATVTPTGLIKGLKQGTVTITATSKKVDTVTASVELTVVQGEIAQTVDWANEVFATHEAYISAAKDAPVKLKGKVTYIAPQFTTDTGDVVVTYFIQNGDEGFYVRDQKVALGEVTLGKVYEVGGFKQWKSGCNSIANVEYFKESTEAIVANEIDITAKTSLAYNDVTDLMGAKVTLTEATVDTVPATLNAKGYDIKVSTSASWIKLRVNPSDVTPEVYQSIWEKISSLLPTQKIAVHGIMNSFGWGKPASQIIITSPEDIVIQELSDQAKVELAVDAIALKHTLDVDTKIELPKTLENIKGVTLGWTSDNEAINVETGAVTHGARDVDVKLTVKATCGEKTATKDIIVTVLSETDTYFTEVARLDFEDAAKEQKYGCSMTKNGYAKGNVTLGGHTWEMDNALIGGAEDDRREGVYSARFQTKYDNGLTLIDGVNFDTVEFLLASYGANPLGTVVKIAYAVGEATEFTVLPREYVVNDYPLVKVRATLPVQAEDIVRVKIFGVKETGQRFNVDNVRLLKTNA